MFNLDKKFASVKLVADVIKTLANSFDVISKAVLQNKKDIRDLQARIKDLENKWDIAKELNVMSIELRIE